MEYTSMYIDRARYRYRIKEEGRDMDNDGLSFCTIMKRGY